MLLSSSAYGGRESSTFDGPSVLSPAQRSAGYALIVPSGQGAKIPSLYEVHKLGSRLLRGQVIEELAPLQPQPLTKLQYSSTAVK